MSGAVHWAEDTYARVKPHRKVPLINTDPSTDYLVTRGDRIAQLVIQRIESVVWNLTNTLEGADRGGGFGHSGR